MGLGTRWILGHGNNQDNRSRHEIFNPKYRLEIFEQNIFEKNSLFGHFSRMWKSWTCFDPLTSASRRDQKRFCKCDGKEGHASTQIYANIQSYNCIEKSNFNQLLRKSLKYVNGIIFYHFYWGIIVKHVQLLSGASKAGFCLIAKPFSLGTMPYYNIMFSICSRTAPKFKYSL